eukprot:Skav235810  [mRNA]  locus=scaffold1267:318967:321832:- [translate_table: standard]
MLSTEESSRSWSRSAVRKRRKEKEQVEKPGDLTVEPPEPWERTESSLRAQVAALWCGAALAQVTPMKRASCLLAYVVLVQAAKVTNLGPEAAEAQAFRSLDRNRDGALTADELEAEIFEPRQDGSLN